MVERDHGVIWALWVMILVGIYALFLLKEVSSLKRKTSIQHSEFRFHLWTSMRISRTRQLFSSKSKFFKLNFDWIETFMRDKIFRISVENRGRSRPRLKSRRTSEQFLKFDVLVTVPLGPVGPRAGWGNKRVNLVEIPDNRIQPIGVELLLSGSFSVVNYDNVWFFYSIKYSSFS